MEQLKFYAPCLFGLEGILANEMKHQGLQNVAAQNGRVTGEGAAEDVARLNLSLRTAERVCLVVGEFDAKSFEELFDGVRRLRWERWIGRADAFPVTGFSMRSALHSVPDCQAIIKKAIVNRLAEHYGIRWFEESGARHVVRFALLDDHVTVMLDTSGEGLHKRGYRPQANAAPIRETLAAGILDISRYRRAERFCDPMCGSGTFAIEAALFATTPHLAFSAPLRPRNGRSFLPGSFHGPERKPKAGSRRLNLKFWRPIWIRRRSKSPGKTSAGREWKGAFGYEWRM